MDLKGVWIRIDRFGLAVERPSFTSQGYEVGESETIIIDWNSGGW